jgi:hypothetical protein
MGTTLTILKDYLAEFIPANKGHFLSIGIGLILIGICIWETAYTSGLRGDLTYLALHPGTSGPLILGGAALVIAALVMKLPSKT